MKKMGFFLSIVVMGCLLVSPVWAESSDSSDLQMLRDELQQLRDMVQSQQQQLQQQDQLLQKQEQKIFEQDRKILDLEDAAYEPIPYANTEEIVERVKAELPAQRDGLTIGGGKIRVTPYGFLRLDMAYDDSPTLHSAGNIVAWAWPEDGVAPPFFPDDDESFQTTATATRIGLNFDGPEFAGGTLRGKLEIDFDEAAGGDFGGDVTAHRIRMRHAYAELVYPTWSLLFGQTWDVVAPRIPYMLDCMVMWGSGNVGYRRPQLRLTKWWDVNGAKITAQGSLNHTDRNVTGSDAELQFLGVSDVQLLDGVEAGWLMIEGRLGLDTVIGEEYKLSLGVSGLIGETEADFPTVGNKEDNNTWLVALDGKVTVIPGLLTVQGEIWTGENINNVYGGILQGLVPVNGGTELEAIPASGGFIHAMATPRKDLKLNLGFGIDDVDDDDLGLGNRSQNWTVFGNAIYTVVPNFDIGLEIAYHETEWVNQNDGDVLRVQTAFIYKF